MAQRPLDRSDVMTALCKIYGKGTIECFASDAQGHSNPSRLTGPHNLNCAFIDLFRLGMLVAAPKCIKTAGIKMQGFFVEAVCGSRGQ